MKTVKCERKGIVNVNYNYVVKWINDVSKCKWVMLTHTLAQRIKRL